MPGAGSMINSDGCSLEPEAVGSSIKSIIDDDEESTDDSVCKIILNDNSNIDDAGAIGNANNDEYKIKFDRPAFEDERNNVREQLKHIIRKCSKKKKKPSNTIRIIRQSTRPCNRMKLRNGLML